MSIRPCLLCERLTPTDPLYAFGRYTVERCRQCGLEFLHPQPERPDLPALYDERYFASGASRARGYDCYRADQANLRKRALILF